MDNQTQSNQAGPATRAIHAGQSPDPLTGAVVPPIHASSTYAQDGVGGLRSGYEYSRAGNPTRAALETCMASLEGGARGLAFASGLAAEDTLIRTVANPGDRILLADDAYGGTYRQFAGLHARWGLEIDPVAITDPDAVADRLQQRQPAMLWLESPTNPLLNVADIAALSHLAHEAGALVVTDNTFASPYLQQPLALGADVVVHSTTKYCGGHSDVVGGMLIAGDQDLGERLAWHQNAIGGIAGPFDSWLVLRGLRTLAMRMERHCDNAERIANWLATRSAVAEVFYPGLQAHPGHQVASAQMKRYGGMISFRVAGGEAAAVKACGQTEIFTLAESLGGVESLIEHPAKMTHQSVAGTPLEVPADLIRLSVGCEDVSDLIGDLDHALTA
jgi:cystathionine gamma-synthase